MSSLCRNCKENRNYNKGIKYIYKSEYFAKQVDIQLPTIWHTFRTYFHVVDFFHSKLEGHPLRANHLYKKMETASVFQVNCSCFSH